MHVQSALFSPAQRMRLKCTFTRKIRKIHAGQHERSMDALSPCIAGGALAAISHITAKLEASFFVNGEQHTHLFGLFFDWASIGFGLFFDWAVGTLDKAHDHELRNPVSLDSLEKH